MKPLISVVIPVYNVSNYIDRCLCSLKYQEFKNYEVIIVDDCGQDDSINKAKDWALQDTRIKILHHEKNLGTYHARHTGTKSANGEYVVYLDPDDAFDVWALEELSNLAVTKPDVLLFGLRYVPEKNFFQVKSNVPSIVDYSGSSLEVKKLLTFKGFSLGTPGKAYNKKIISRAFESLNVPITFRLIYGEDVLLFSEVLANTKSIKSTQQKIYLYSQVEESITKSTDFSMVLKNIEQLNYVICKLKDIAINNSKNSIVYDIVIAHLSIDVLVLENKAKIPFLKVMKNYFIIAVLTKNIRWVVKAFFYMFSLGKKKY